MIGSMRYGSLFSGIGGLDLGLDRVGMECAFQVEIDPFCREVLGRHWPNVPKYDDVRRFPPDDVKFDIDLLAGGFPCFPAGTLIDTESGPKPIEELRVGDLVVTHRNRLRRVSETMNRKAADLIRIRAFGSLPFETTSEHPFLVVKRNVTRKGKYRNPFRCFSEPFWIKASELTKDHFLAQTLYRSESKINWESPEFWYLVGRYLGDGWIVNHKRKSKIIGRRGSRVNSMVWKVIVCCSKKEGTELAKRIGYAGFYGCPAPENNIVKFHISSKRLVRFLMQFGHGACHKSIPEWVFSAPQEILRSLWNGLVDSDGYKTLHGRKEYSSCSLSLALAVSRLVRLVENKPAGFYIGNKSGSGIIEGRKVNINESYSVRVSGKRTIGFSDGEHVWVPIRDISRTNVSATVYNVSVEEDDSYVASSFVVHNCKQVSNARTAQVAVPEGLEGKDSGLWFEMRRVIRGMRPRWVVVENVGALSTRGLDTVLWEIAQCGYDATWQVVSAESLGAPHLRRRIFVVAVQNTYGEGLEGHVSGLLAQPGARGHDSDVAGPDWGDTAPRLCGVAHGIPPRVVMAKERLRALGNAVVPRVGEFIGRRILEADKVLFGGKKS